MDAASVADLTTEEQAEIVATLCPVQVPLSFKLSGARSALSVLSVGAPVVTQAAA